MSLSPCQQHGHDYGNGPGALAPLREKEQTCPHCGLSRKLVDGTLKYSRKAIRKSAKKTA